jgi:CYTH domain-containing protein
MARTGVEIERKFIVDGEFETFSCGSFRIRQGYLSTDEGRTVRVRIKGEEGFLTIKGRTSDSGMSRYEWEKEIPLEEASRLLDMCPAIIDKTRYIVPYCGHVFEVDVFYGDNEGLIVAEIELESEDQKFKKPSWLGKEVTGDLRYFNSMLLRNPYNKW